MKRLLPSLLIALSMTVGCAMNPKPVTGSANQFDSDTYLALATADSVIQTTKADLTNGTFPVNIAGNVKTALNNLIKSYDVADKVYLAYHAAAIAGTVT